MTKSKFIAGIFLIVLYIIFLLPYSIVSSVDKEDIVKNGIVVSSQTIQYQSFPRGIQDILPNKTDYNLIIIKKVDSPEKSALIFEGDQYLPNDFVKVEDLTTDIYIDSHILSTVDKPFNKLIIGKLNKVTYGGDYIEYLTANKLTFLIALSKAFFYLGGLLIIIVISLLFTGRLEMWTIPGVLSSYSFQFFIINTLSILNQGDVIATRLTPSIIDNLVVPFGYLFIILIPVTVFIKKYEDTNKGQQMLFKLFQYQIQVAKSFISIFKK